MRTTTLQQLRRAAKAHPHDATRARQLALFELLGEGGDAKAASEALARARALDPDDPWLWLAAGIDHDVHGRPSAALQAFLSALQAGAAHVHEPGMGHLVELATAAVSGAATSVPGFLDRALPRLRAVFQRAALPWNARTALGELLIALAHRQGDRAEIARVASELSCVQQARVAGPFGPRQLLGFDAPPPLAVGQRLAERYDLGSARGVRPTRSVRARGCSLQLGAGQVAEAGTTFAQAEIDVPRAGRYVFRLETPNSAELYLGGKSVRRVDRRTHLGARAVYFELALPAGRQLLTLKVSTRHPSPVAALAWRAAVPADAHGLALPEDRAHDGPSLYLRAAIALLRGDVLAARSALAEGPDEQTAPALSLLQRASVVYADPLLPDDVRGDEARRLLARAGERDPELWAPPTQLASLAAQTGRVTEAITILRAAAERWPQVPAIGFALLDLLRDKQWDAEAERVIARLRALLPDACAPLSAELGSLQQRRRMVEAAKIAELLSRCDAQSHALYQAALARKDTDAAQRELSRLRALDADPSGYAWLLAELGLRKQMGDAAGAQAIVAELRARFPRSYGAAIEQLDATLATAGSGPALALAQQTLAAEPAALVGLHRLLPVLGGEHVLARYRKDGAQAIAAFEAKGQRYQGPQVLVLDYLAQRVWDDGSALMLVHSIQKVQSEEAVDELAEVSIPQGAQVLTLRAWKPDGRRLEADGIAGKESVSLPDVRPGDYVELEYLQASAAPDAFPHGFVGERFYFKSFEVPFDHTQMVVLLPEDMPYTIDPRGAAPVVQERLDGELRVLDWKVEGSEPLVAEPASVPSREYVPSVRVGVRASWAAMFESVRDALADRDVYDPYYAKLVRKIVGEAAATDHRTRAERLYTFVLANVENTNDVFGQAATMLRAKAGNRARVLHYLLGLAGVPSTLALARSFTADATSSDMADGDTYEHLLVRVGGSADPIWLFTVERFAPFGFIPGSLRGQPARLLAPGGAEVRVSDGLLGPDERRFDLEIELRASGAARLRVTESLHGGDAIAWRSQLDDIPAAELQRRFEQDYVARLFPGAALSSLEIVGREQDRADLVLRYVVEVASYGRRAGRGLALPPLLPSELSAAFARSATRKRAALIGAEARSTLRARIKLPPGARLEREPAPLTLSAALPARPVFRDRASAARDGTITLARSLVLPRMRIDPKDYPAFAELCRRVDEREARELVITLP